MIAHPSVDIIFFFQNFQYRYGCENSECAHAVFILLKQKESIAECKEWGRVDLSCSYKTSTHIPDHIQILGIA
jgi:hypothetical protein